MGLLDRYRSELEPMLIEQREVQLRPPAAAAAATAGEEGFALHGYTALVTAPPPRISSHICGH